MSSPSPQYTRGKRQRPCELSPDWETSAISSTAEDSFASRGGGGSDCEDEDPLYFSTEELIHLVEVRPALWDQSDPQHCDQGAIKCLWLKIFKALIPDYEELTTKQRKLVGDRIQRRWRSVRDRFMREVNLNSKIPSGSSAPRRSVYKYSGILQFLHRCLQLRQTQTNTITEAPQEEAAGVSGAGASGGEASSPVPEAARLSSALQSSRGISSVAGSRQRRLNRRGRHCDEEALGRLIIDGFQRVENNLGLTDHRLRQLEIAQAPEPPNECRHFLLSLQPLMEQMNLSQRLNFRCRVNAILAEILEPPPVVEDSPPASMERFRA
ncbi:hypothetical protein GDO81_028883 [Engystomops pustulosus]|uniref:MADF domain-containing protein n=1 Tax=Engystomops pustulosus TaxID=76066 RepID=A0AAV6ZIL3_ENGPU|nr:hypothetical protein GDO81_028883 [Engystomops pustulosus]KAG8547191.1 hypothetical protein GDO81_028883 [Engystomops pustulosus]KAG8547192.1 hypothetical protein GDO81_028883 [Engystomops pustulosus]